MKRQTAAQKLITKQVDAAVGRALANRPIPLMAITKVYDRAWYLVGNGHTAEHLEAGLKAFIDQIEVKV
jgi:hypothetical protein